jgi:hypothetical protein
MRKVILTMDENQKHTIIKKLVEINGNKKRAALPSESKCSAARVSVIPLVSIIEVA